MKILKRSGELQHIILEPQGIKYITGDHVYFKRADSREWHGLARVLGKDGQQVLVKNRSTYVRVHPCRLQLIPLSPRPTPETETTIKTPNPQNPKLTHYPASFRPQTDSSSQEEASSSEDDDEDTQEYGNNNTIPSKQQENRHNRYHRTTVRTKIKPNITFEYKLENSPWKTVNVLSHAGKATGKFSNCWNTINHNNFKQPIDFSKIAQQKIVEETSTPSVTQSDANEEMEIIEQLSSLSLEEDEIQTHETLIVQNKEKTMEAKPKEHHQWKSEKVYEEVPNQGQNFISQIDNKR